MKLAFPLFDEHELNNVAEALASGWVTQGPFVDRFEQRFVDYQNCQYSIATTSCTAALHLAMAALDLGPGDEVIVPAFTWVTSAHCAEYMGAKVVFVEVDPLTFNIDPLAIEDKITSNTKAIVAVHLFGLSAEMDSINDIAQKYELAVVEDAACAIGTTYNGKMVGTLGTIGCFSFHPRKTITTGEGGMVTTSNKALATKLNSLRNHGASTEPARNDEPHGPWTMNAFPNLGFNLRLSDIQAAVGVAQFDKLDGLLEQRKARANQYNSIFSSVSQIQPPRADGHSYQSYVIRLPEFGRKNRNYVMSALDQAGIACRPGTHCVSNTAYYQEKYKLSREDFPISSSLEDETITLPLFPGMLESDVDKVSEILLDCVHSI